MATHAYCLDTDVLIELLRGTEAVVARLRTLPDDARVCITHITAYEVLRGAFAVGDAEECQRVMHFVAQFDFVEQTVAADRLAAEWWAHLRAHGTPLPDADLIIAASGTSIGATLITRNRKHFSRIPGILVEFW